MYTSVNHGYFLTLLPKKHAKTTRHSNIFPQQTGLSVFFRFQFNIGQKGFYLGFHSVTTFWNQGES